MKFQGEKFKQILILISEGTALRDATKAVGIGNNTFYDWIENSADLRERYVTATDERATSLVEDMLKIADGTELEGVNKAKLQVDTRKWIASRLRPKKYGDLSQLKVTDGEGQPLKPIIINLGSGTNPDETTE